MIDIKLPIYDEARKSIDFYKNSNNWEDVIDLYEPIKSMNQFKEYDISKNEWIALVKDMQENYELPDVIKKRTNNTTMISTDSDNDTTIPDEPRSSWILYKNKLTDSGWSEDSIDNLEMSTYSLLKKLDFDTSHSEPVKGLVIGQVQSGKTASMAALMAMSADWGWNTFIVLSGMVDNLRIQTQERLIKDLSSDKITGNNQWISLPKLSKNMENNNAQELNFNKDSHTRHLNVVLKNKSRLENLIAWLEADKDKLKQMKILIIDDEADQASVNTSNIEDSNNRAKINDLIIKLVEIGQQSNSSPTSMNYISYTATPYANFLNEYGSASLYPKNFIGTLPSAKEYFGPKEIFGHENYNEDVKNEGLNIIRNISLDDLELTKELQKGEISDLPNSLISSLTWFLISTAIRRYEGVTSPTSMLIHTSQRQYHHQNISDGINNWLSYTPDNDILNICKGIYNSEKNRFSKKDFRFNFSDYPTDYSINDYPDFDKIQDEIINLIREVTHIKMDGDGDLTYTEGIHLCIDNCAHNGIDDEDQHVRLAYPSKQQSKYINKSPAFIIIGGSTLSRGLTIEGLVSTYFLRATIAGDSLMQMGRWFGFRRGYELLPRIWMTDDTLEKFEFLTELEEELRKELMQFETDLKSPMEYGPRVKNSPKTSWLRVTAKNKMQGATEVDMDFSGASIQTIHFENDKMVLEKNVETTMNFLENHCGYAVKSPVTNSVVYSNVDFSVIKNELLQKMVFHPRSRVFNNIDAFIEWYEKVKDELKYNNWNVIVAGTSNVETVVKNENQWKLGSYVLTKVNRSAKSFSEQSEYKTANIGVLRSPADVFADINHPEFKLDSAKISNKDMEKVRAKYNLENTPQLIIYRIDKDSIARKAKNPKDQKRQDLNFDEDIIGIYMNIPGSSSSKPHAKALQLYASYPNETDE